MAENKLSNIIKYLVLAFFLFLPFERLLTLEIFGLTAKISFAILGVISLVFIIGWPKARILLEEKLLLIFAILSFLSVFWSVDKTRSAIISAIYLATFIGYFCLSRVLNKNLVESVKNLLIYLATVLAIFALWQYFADLWGFSNLSFLRPEYSKAVFGFPRVQATFLEPLFFANFFFLPIYFNLEKILSSEKVGWFYPVNQILLSLIFLLTLSRGGYFGLIGSMIFLAAVIIIKFRQKAKRLGVILLTTLIGILAGVLLVYFTASRQSFNLFIAHSSVADAESGESTISRVEIAKIAIKNILDRPWGIGAGAFGALPEFKDKIPTSGYQTVNNIYLEVLVEEGILGFLLLAIFFIITIKNLYQKLLTGDGESLIYLSIFLAISIQAVSLSPIYLLPLWAFLALVRGKNS